MTEKNKETIQTESEDERVTAEDISLVIYPLNSKMGKMKKKEKPGE